MSRFAVTLRGGSLAVFLCCAWLSSFADDLKASAAQVKAAYLLKLPSFVEWPAEGVGASQSNFVIGVLEADDVWRALEEMSKGTKVLGRPVRVLRLGREDPAATPQLVFLGAQARDVTAVVAKAKVAGSLVVADRDDGIALGAALQFVEVAGRIRFEAAPENASQHGLKLSARLLSVALRSNGSSP